MVASAIWAAPVVDSKVEEPQVESSKPAEARQSDVGAARGRANSEREAPNGEAGAGKGTLDLLLEMRDRPLSASEKSPLAAARVGGTDSARAGERRPAAASAVDARQRLVDLPAATPTSEVDPNSDNPGQPKWVSGFAAQTSGSNDARSAEPSGYRGDLYGADLNQAPTRKFLLLLREYREWLVLGGGAIVLLMLGSSAVSSRRRRRR